MNKTVIEVRRALGDPVRLKIVNELRGETRCACDLAGVSPSLLSHHLKSLREVGLITGERRGRWIDYSLVSAMIDYSLVSAMFEALSETFAPLASELGPDDVGEVCGPWAFSSVS